MRKTEVQIRFVLFLSLLGILFSIATASGSEEKKVLWVELNEPITPGSADKVSAAVQAASAEKYNAVLISLDTLGGSADSTFKIIDVIQSSNVPVIGYVYPPGTNAWSAGTIILEASDLAAMSPYSVIGSSQPVVGTEPTNESKIVNAIVGKLLSLADLHGRNSSQVARFVTHNDNLTPEMAWKNHVIDVIADNPDDLMSKANGMKVRTLHGEIVLDTLNATVVKYNPSVRSTLLGILSDPIVATMFLSIGILAIILGLSHPGFGIEIFGGVLLLLGLVGQGFDVNWAALVLTAIGAALLVFELHVHVFGIMGIGGVIILAIGMALLVAQPVQPMLVPTNYATESIITLSVMLIPLAALFGFLMFKAYKATKMKTAFSKYPVGKGKAVDDISSEKEGYISISGEYWLAKSSTYIKSGSPVKIVGSKDKILLVDPVTEETDSQDFENKKKI